LRRTDFLLVHEGFFGPNCAGWKRGCASILHLLAFLTLIKDFLNRPVQTLFPSAQNRNYPPFYPV
jgi:hypothetical protein